MWAELRRSLRSPEETTSAAQQKTTRYRNGWFDFVSFDIYYPITANTSGIAKIPIRMETEFMNAEVSTSPPASSVKPVAMEAIGEKKSMQRIVFTTVEIGRKRTIRMEKISEKQ